MGAILKMVNRATAMLKNLFSEDHSASRMNVVKPAPGDRLYKNIIILLKANPDFPAYRTDARLLHRRLRQYRRLGYRAGRAARTAYLRRLEKQWKKVVRNKMKRIKFENDRRRAVAGMTSGKIIPVSHEPGK